MEPVRILERVDLADLAREATALVRPRLLGSPSIALESDITPTGPVPAHAPEVVGAVVNLIGNALDACGDHGRVVVRVGGDERHAWIEVDDDGPGMTADIAARVFEPFFSTKGAEGTGLGLANVYATMARHAGEVELDTAPGRGARFRLRFPRTPST
jgi:signal transduction histidine kinase